MTDTQLDIIEMKHAMQKMQNDIAELAIMIIERESNINARLDRLNTTMNLVPSTQACDVLYDKE